MVLTVEFSVPFCTTPNQGRVEPGNSISSLTIAGLEYHCAQETQKFRAGYSYDDQYGCELFRRAIEERDERAWESIFTLYSPLVTTWILQYTSETPLLQLQGGSVSLVNAVFTKFWHALSNRKGKHYDFLASILQYLKDCTRSVVADEWRRVRKHWNEDSIDICVHDEVAIDDPSTQAISHLCTEEFWLHLQQDVHDEEWLVLTCTFHQDMRPYEIHAQYPIHFPTIGDVYRVKRNILDRLRRNREFLLLARQMGYYLQEEIFSKNSAFVGQKKGGEDAIKENTLSPSVEQCPRQHVTMSTQESSIKSTQPVFLSSNDASQNEQNEHVLHQVHKELLRLFAQRETCVIQAQQTMLLSLQQHITCVTTETEKVQEIPPVYEIEKTLSQKDFFRDQSVGSQQLLLSLRREETPREKQKTHYYQQMTRCSKKRCKKCQEHIGHGPYWYAYWSEQGRTVSILVLRYHGERTDEDKIYRKVFTRRGSSRYYRASKKCISYLSFANGAV